jgi:outer membrane protein insertion porin family
MRKASAHRRPVYPRRRVQFRRALSARLSDVGGHRFVRPRDIGEPVPLVWNRAIIGTNLKFGIPLREDLSLQLRYSIYAQQISLSSSLDDCTNINPNFTSTFPTPVALAAASLGVPGGINAAYPGWQPANFQSNCLYQNNLPLYVAALPIREELSYGTEIVSQPGYGLTFNTLDNNKHPTSGLLVNFGQDIAGLGGTTAYLRSVIDFRGYYEVVSDLVGVLHLQGGDMLGLKKCPTSGTCVSNNGYVSVLDDFKMGQNLVRGFQPAGLGPRDQTIGGADDALGGTMYWGASLEFQYPFYFLPKDAGFRGAVFVDSGSEWGYKGETQYPATGEINGLVTPNIPGTSYVCQCGLLYADSSAPRVSVGASLIWDSPFGPLRFDFAYPVLKQPYDRTQFFQFGGGARF